MKVGNFVNSWGIKWRDGVEGHGIQQGWTLLIGTGSDYGDSEPFFSPSPDYEVRVGFSMINQDGAVELSTEPPGPRVPRAPGYRQPGQDMSLFLIGEQLCWRGELGVEIGGELLIRPFEVYISVAPTLAGGEKTVKLYGSSTWGDPEQMAVWGGSGTPPPSPRRRHPRPGRGRGA